MRCAVEAACAALWTDACAAQSSELCAALSTALCAALSTRACAALWADACAALWTDACAALSTVACAVQSSELCAAMSTRAQCTIRGEPGILKVGFFSTYPSLDGSRAGARGCPDAGGANCRNRSVVQIDPRNAYRLSACDDCTGLSHRMSRKRPASGSPSSSALPGWFSGSVGVMRCGCCMRVRPVGGII